MIEKSEYQLKQPQPAYLRSIDSVIIAAFIALGCLVILLSLTQFQNVSKIFISINFILFLASLSWIFYILRIKAHKYPDWNEYHEKVLAPKKNYDYLKKGLTIPITLHLHRSDQLLSGIFAFIGLAILSTLGVMGVKSYPMMLLGGIVLIICLWSMVRLKRISVNSVKDAIKADSKGITFPIASIEVTAANKLAKNKQSHITIVWGDIKQWIVDSGGFDDPAIYQIKTINRKRIDVYRSVLRERELELLEYVRAAGVTILLKDSIEN